MHVKVQTTWRTRALFLAVFAVAGVIAWVRTAQREAQTDVVDPRGAESRADPYFVEVELAADGTEGYGSTGSDGAGSDGAGSEAGGDDAAGGDEGAGDEGAGDEGAGEAGASPEP